VICIVQTQTKKTENGDDDNEKNDSENMQVEDRNNESSNKQTVNTDIDSESVEKFTSEVLEIDSPESVNEDEEEDSSESESMSSQPVQIYTAFSKGFLNGFNKLPSVNTPSPTENCQSSVDTIGNGFQRWLSRCKSETPKDKSKSPLHSSSELPDSEVSSSVVKSQKNSSQDCKEPSDSCRKAIGKFQRDKSVFKLLKTIYDCGSEADESSESCSIKDNESGVDVVYTPISAGERRMESIAFETVAKRREDDHRVKKEELVLGNLIPGKDKRNYSAFITAHQIQPRSRSWLMSLFTSFKSGNESVGLGDVKQQSDSSETKERSIEDDGPIAELKTDCSICPGSQNCIAEYSIQHENMDIDNTSSSESSFVSESSRVKSLYEANVKNHQEIYVDRKRVVSDEYRGKPSTCDETNSSGESATESSSSQCNFTEKEDDGSISNGSDHVKTSRDLGDTSDTTCSISLKSDFDETDVKSNIIVKPIYGLFV